VHDDIREIHEHPFTLARAFHTHGAKVVLLGELHHAIGNGFDVAVGVAGGDDDDVGDVGELPHVHDLDVDGFHVIERGIDDAQQGLRDGALFKRLLGRR
jgi:hypothetical protein